MITRDWESEKRDLQEAFDIISDKLVKADLKILKLKDEIEAMTRGNTVKLPIQITCSNLTFYVAYSDYRKGWIINSVDSTTMKVVLYPESHKSLRDAFNHIAVML